MLATVGLWVVDKVLGYLGKRSDRALEEYRIEAGVRREEIGANVALSKEAASVVKAGMKFPIFWVPWSISAISMSVWFGWGMMDSLFNGALPDVAELPPQLKEYADAVWANIFYAGGIVGGAQIAASTARAVLLRGRS